MRAKVTLQNIADDEAEAYCRSVGFLSDGQKPPFLAGDLRAELAGYRSSDLIRGCMSAARRSDLDQLLYTDIKTYLVDDILTKVDRASMAVALEVRVPLLDHPFMEFAHRIPPEMKIQGGEGKVVFKSALRGRLDDETLDRPKQGFTPPLTEWLRGPLREMAGDLLLGHATAYADYIDPVMVRKAWQAHQARLRDYTPLIYCVLVFELWARRFLRDDLGGP